MNNLKTLIEFLEKLEECHIYYRLNKVRDECVMVEIAVPGQRWEVEFFADEIQVEVFKSDGRINDETYLEVLFRDFSD